MDVITVAEQLRAQRRDELALRNMDGAAAPLLQFHLMADVSRELNQTVLHSYVSASCRIFPSAAEPTDFCDESIVQAVQQTLPPAPVLSIST